jgi:acetyl-CoA C-acetyltransferase
VSENAVVIVSAARTPIGNFQGSLKSLSATELGSVAIKAALERGQLSPEHVDEVFMGCVLPAGLGQAPARQAALGAGLSTATSCTTVNKVCGSGMQAVIMAHNSLAVRPHQILIAGGMESMTNAPYLLPKARAGYRFGHQTVVDHMLYDGLEDAYQKGSAMGLFAEECAGTLQFTREQQDEFTITSVQRAQAATADGSFAVEITPVTVPAKQGSLQVTQDEGPLTAQVEKIPQLNPIFRSGGTVTAANSSSLSDGAAALALMRATEAEKRGLKPLATLVGHSSHAQTPSLFTTAPIGAIKKLLENLRWKVADVDLFEINEAFAVVTLAAMRELQLPPEKVNVHGGATVLGHPIGASGARIIVTLLYALKKYKLRRGVAALCIGGGEATAVAVEMW